MIYDYLIVGSGISGVSVAKLLQNKQNRVIVLEAKSEIGGLVNCVESSGHLYHKVGGHVFNSKNQDVLDWFWNHFNKDEEFLRTKRKAKIWFQDRLIGYPIENYLYQLSEETVKKVIKEILKLNNQDKIEPFEYDNFEAFLKGNFGETLYELYFKPYNQKIWRYNLSNVPMEWLKGKLPMPNYQDLILKNILKQEESEMVHSSFYYPKHGGSQFIINRLSEGLDIQRNTAVKNLEFKDSFWLVNDTLKARNVIYTGDIRKLSYVMPKIANSLKTLFDSLKQLPSHGTSNLLCECDKTDLSWLYLPEQHLKAHRIIYTGNFSPNNNSVELPQDRISCTVEFSGKQSWNEMVEEIKKLPGNLKALDLNHEANSYVIHDLETANVIMEVRKKLKDLNFELLGRFAEWEYYNMDKAIEAAMTISNSE